MYTNYLTHDIGARNDPKLMKVQMKMGMAGLGLYWCIVEMLWQFGGYLDSDYDTIAYSLHCSAEEVRQLVEQFDLFICEDGKIRSESVLRRLAHRDSLSKVRSEAGKKGAATTNGRRQLSANAAITNNNSRGVDDANAGQPISNIMAKVNTNSGNCPSVDATINESTNTRNPQTKSFSISESERERIIEIFFFRNVTNPIRETERFVEYYEAHGWMFGNGQPIKNVEATAKTWRTENQSIRFDTNFLSWYQTVYASIEDPHMRKRLLIDIEAVNVRSKEISIRYKTREIAEFIATFVHAKHLEQGYTINWKVSNNT
ncbi:MAG: DUF4373 domain-containing protein [Bacteroidales bacterium]|nr:DUF4373 domain-containing protein [Bacteroidales bacterium]